MPDSSQQTVFLVEDDDATRDSLAFMLRSHHFSVRCYSTAEQLLGEFHADMPGCLVLDLQLPSMSGLDLRKVLRERGCQQPFLIVTGYGDVTSAVEAIQDGAVNFLEKPIDREKFVACVREGLKRDNELRRDQVDRAKIDDRLESLTPRETQVMKLVVDGKLTKQIAKELGISTKTVEVHRSHVTRKMHVHSVAQLVRVITQHRGNDLN